MKTSLPLYTPRMRFAPLAPLLAIVLLYLSFGSGIKSMQGDFAACLPEGVTLEDIVSAPLPKASTAAGEKKVTVKETLSRLKARCHKGKIVDGGGREIYFQRLIGCWGNPPEDYQEQIKRQNEELQRLKKKYTVIELPCAQTDPRQIH